MDIRDFKAAAARLFFDMINADGVIDDDEIVNLETLKTKYSINDEDVIKAQLITTSQSLWLLKTWRKEYEKYKSKTEDGLYTTQNIINDLAELSGCDGDRDLDEAKLLGVVSLCLSESYDALPISYRENTMRFSRKEIIYVNCHSNSQLETEIERSKPYLECLLSVYGYDFVYIPHIVEFLCGKLEIIDGHVVSDKLTPIIKFTNPIYLTNDGKAERFIDIIQNVNTQGFTSDFVRNSSLNQSIGPHLLVKIKTSTIPEKNTDGRESYIKYTDFIALPIVTTVEEAIKTLPNMILSHTRSITSVVRRQLIEKLYCKGFHKTLIDYAISQEWITESTKVEFQYNVLKEDKNKRKYYITGIKFNQKNVGFVPLGSKEWTIFLLIIYLSAYSGGKGLSKNPTEEAHKLYKIIYGAIGKYESGLKNNMSVNISTLKNKLNSIINLSNDFRSKIKIETPDDNYRVSLDIDSVVVSNCKLKDEDGKPYSQSLTKWIESLLIGK